MPLSSSATSALVETPAPAPAKSAWWAPIGVAVHKQVTLSRGMLALVATALVVVAALVAVFVSLWLADKVPFLSSPFASASTTSPPPPPAPSVVVSTINSQLQYDANGLLVNCHAGGVYQFPHLDDGGLYYMYGDTYTSCMQSGPVCNQTTFCGYYNDLFSLYTSYNLVNWTLASANVFPAMLLNSMTYFYFTPNVGYNAATQLFYLTWTGSQYGNGPYVPFATSASPYGPFVEPSWSPVRLQNSSTRVSSTIVLFVDPVGGAGFVRYNTADSPHRHAIEQLSDDWQSTVAGALVYVKDDYPWFEAGAMFYRQGWYYNTIGTDACYAQWGASVLVLVAPAPMGPWSVQESNVNPCSNGQQPVVDFPSQEDGAEQFTIDPCGAGVSFTVPGQQFGVVAVNGSYYYFGEHYNSAPDGQKWHDLQLLVPFQFNDAVSPPTILPMSPPPQLVTLPA